MDPSSLSCSVTCCVNCKSSRGVCEMRQPRLSSVFLPVKGETAVPVDVKSSQGRRRAVCVFPPNLFIYNSQLVPFSLGSVWPHKTLQPSRMQGSSAQPGVAAPPPRSGPLQVLRVRNRPGLLSMQC